MASPTLKADDSDRLTEVRFNQPIQIPGNIVLAPGTHWFRVEDNPDVVVIYNQDQTQVEALLLTKPVESTTPAPETEFTMAERPQSQPDTLLIWYYPGKRFGPNSSVPAVSSAS